MPVFTRGFRLHHNRRVLDGAEFPSSRTFVIDDPEYGFATVATSMEELLKGYHGARVEWPGDHLDVRRRVADVLWEAGGPEVSHDAVIDAVLGLLTEYLGYDVAERAAEQEASRPHARGDTDL